MKKLTIKEQKFAELCVTLGNQTEAYRQAYNPSNKDAEWVKVRASETANKSNVKVTIDNLKADIKKDNKITRQTLIDYHQRMIDAWQELWELGQKEKLTADQKTRFYLLKELVKGSDMRGSTDSIAKLTGLNEPDKIEHKHEIVAHKTKWS